MDDFRIGDRIAYYLSVKGITQKDFAKLCNIKEVTLSRYISGQREPKISTVMKMAILLEVSVDDLVDTSRYIENRYCKEIEKITTAN